ncbi:DUF6968 family protein [Sorangium cellulosum]|uniref:DUF6968 domain-containing protein n=1 Tax=Sorangium cellulosum So0157-2 TaxID=1254432 RepID=S4YBP2_SORCE|nr:hypothetical protein [Sorangium cellulosum]AGP40218.1 hypothetical protein SCE1572_40370 [Sorangium cellulosum So0157-2]
MPDVIAERTLELTLPSGTQEGIRVRVWAPEYSPYFRCWVADVEVAGAGDTDKSHGAGIDAFQALYSALHLIPAMLVKYEDDGRLSWLGEGWTGVPAIDLTNA